MVLSILDLNKERFGDDMNSNKRINPKDLKYRRIKERERMTFYEYAFESTIDFAENVIGINFDVLKKICKINRMLLGLPFKILVRNMKDIFVEHQDEIVAGYTLIYDKKKDEFELGNLFTRPEFQGRGIGNAVMQCVVEDCENKTIKLSVNKTNEAAIHLYKKYGFQEDYSIKEYFQEIPLEVESPPNGFIVRFAIKEDLDNLNRIVTEIPEMKDLPKKYKKTFNKTEKKKLRMQNQLPAVLVKNGEIMGIGRALWSKGAPETAQIAAVAFLPETKEAYPYFVSFLTKQIKKFGVKKFSWTNNRKTEQFAEFLEPFLKKPTRTGLEMSRVIE